MPSGALTILAKGENNIPMLVGIGLRSRLSRHVFTTDIKKMYNSLILIPQHYCYQLVYIILDWRQISSQIST